ncbi:MAG: transcriptional regulator [Chloroflexi bacterium RBG_16_72_14]|nr:MAG: transcriptional regulator [Chloroflexi bacterium RBG_16_72_14]
MRTTNRDVREVIREEPVMRSRILAVLADGPLTVPEIAAAIDAPTHEVVLWVMGMRRYGWLAEIKGSPVDGYFQYQRTGRVS